jgi:hypothetical protein
MVCGSAATEARLTRENREFATENEGRASEEAAAEVAVGWTMEQPHKEESLPSSSSLSTHDR